MFPLCCQKQTEINMTVTKAKRLKQGLVDRYGADKVLVLYYDAYFPYKEGSRVVDNYIAKLTLADIEIDSWDMYKRVEKICKHRYPIEKPIKTEESKKRYDSPEEQEKRKEEERKLERFTANYGMFNIFNSLKV